MIYIILEVVKTLGWSIILIIVLFRRKELTINVYWLSLISSLLMVVAGIEDITNYAHLMDKSIWWLFANIFILANYFIVIRGCCSFYSETQQRLDDFIKKVEKDKKELF